MPQDPREGSFGHQRPRQEQPDEETGEASPAGRRRRALGDDGTGGTRVFDLLSKHGKPSGQGTTGHRRRQPEADPESTPPPEQQQPPKPQPPQQQPSQPQQQPPAPPRPPQQPPAHQQPPQQPPAHQQPPAEPPAHQQPPAEPPPKRAAQQQPPSQPPAEPGPDPRNGWASPAEGQSAPRPPRPAEPGGAPQPPRNTPRRPNGPPPANPAVPPAQPPPSGPAAAPPANAPAQPPRQPRTPAEPDSGDRPGGDEATRISQALSGGGSPASPTDSEQPPRPQPPARPGPEATRRQPVPPTPQAPPARPATPPDDAEVTARQAPVPAAPPVPEATPKPAEHDSSGAESIDDVDEPDDADRATDDDQEHDENTRAIDATLARFSAVHDQIAEEEAERRNNRLGRLLGRRKEPELGQDMPFDFTQGRDAQASRMESKQQQRRQRTIRAVKALAITAAVLVFVSTGIGWSAKAWVDAKFREVSALDQDSSAIVDAGLQSGDRNFLLVGSDTRAETKAGEGVGTAKNVPGARGDTTMIAHIPADRSRMVIVSLPRDLEVDLPDCRQWNPKTGDYSSEPAPDLENVKFNVAYATGGPKCTTKLVQQISGLSITNFLGIDFHGFQAMVDSVGGVRVCSRTPIVDEVLGPVFPKAGVHELNGQEALKYVRARHVQGDPTAGYGRMERQQLFLSALLRKVMSANVLLDPGKLTGFVNAVTANTFGENISTDQLISLGKSLQGLKSDKVTFVTVPTTGEPNENGNEELRESDAHALFRAIIEGTPIAPEKPSEPRTRKVAHTDSVATQPASTSASGATARPAQAPAPKPVKPSQVEVKVLNTTSQAGLAGETGDELRDVGFTVSGVDDLSSRAEGTIIRHSAANTRAAQLLATSIPGAKLVEDPAAGKLLELELGSDYEGTVNSPDTGKPDVPENLATVNAGKDLCGGGS